MSFRGHEEHGTRIEEHNVVENIFCAIKISFLNGSIQRLHNWRVIMLCSAGFGMYRYISQTKIGGHELELLPVIL